MEPLIKQSTLHLSSCFVEACSELSKSMFTLSFSLTWIQTNRKIKYLELFGRLLLWLRDKATFSKLACSQEVFLKQFLKIIAESVHIQFLWTHQAFTEHLIHTRHHPKHWWRHRTKIKMAGLEHSMEKVQAVISYALALSWYQVQENPIQADLSEQTKSISLFNEKYRGAGLKWGLIHGLFGIPTLSTFWIFSPKYRLPSQILCEGKMASHSSRSISSLTENRTSIPQLYNISFGYD